MLPKPFNRLRQHKSPRHHQPSLVRENADLPKMVGGIPRRSLGSFMETIQLVFKHGLAQNESQLKKVVVVIGIRQSHGHLQERNVNVEARSSQTFHSVLCAGRERRMAHLHMINRHQKDDAQMKAAITMGCQQEDSVQTPRRSWIIGSSLKGLPTSTLQTRFVQSCELGGLTLMQRDLQEVKGGIRCHERILAVTS